MKKCIRKEILIGILIVSVILGMVVVIHAGGTEKNGNGDYAETRDMRGGWKYTSHEPIYIDGNEDFASQASSEGWAGDGTEGNPYVIENYDINASSADGIYIYNTDVYFIIRNCTIHDGKSNNHDCIYFYSVTNGRIDNLTSYNNSYGIELWYSSNNIITNCTVYNNFWYGIYLYSSSNNNTISNCIVYNNNDYGIYLDSASNNTICVCNISNNYCGGIKFISSCNNLISICDVYDNGGEHRTTWGILLTDHSTNNTLSKCEIYNNYYRGIHLDWSSNNNINNCKSYNTGYGIQLANSSDSTIINCTFYANYVGVDIWLSSNRNAITNCTVYNNDDGICLYYSSNNQITNCSVYNNSYGIYLYHSLNNEIHYCNIYNNSEYGIYNYDSESQYQVNATYNWWGSTNGPGVDGANPVSANVLYDPWLTEPWEEVKKPVHNLDKNTYYDTIQEAINDAESGNTIFVSAGTYYENIVLDKTLTLIGENENNTIIDGNGTGDVIYISADWVNLSGFGVRNGGNGIYDAGIDIHSSANQISNCQIYNNSQGGIYLESSSNNTITNCTVFNNSQHGIIIEFSSHNTIINCASHNNFYFGICIYSASNNSIINCDIYNNSGVWDSSGIYVYNSSNNNIIGNTFINEGILIEGDYLNNYVQNIDENTVNGKPLYYFLNQNSVIIDGWDAGQLILVNCTGFTIRNVDISYTAVGIEFGFCSNNSITNCAFYNNPIVGIYFLFSSNNSITNCTIYNNSYGIYVYSSSNNVISNCNVSNNGRGVYLEFSSNNIIQYCNVYLNDYEGVCGGMSSNTVIQHCNIYSNSCDGIGFLNSPNNTISNCDIWDNYEGIHFHYLSDYILPSSNNTIQYCNISNNTWGISYNACSRIIISNCNISNNDNGIYTWYSPNCSISNCNIQNGYYGIGFYASSNNTISACYIYNNSYGIYLYHSLNNEIHYNNIYNNSEYGIYNYDSESQYQVNATYNWWGSTNGPSGAIGGPGFGDNVSVNVLYDPWLAEPYHSPLITIIQPEEGLITNQNVTLEYMIDVPLTSTGNPIAVNIDGPPSGINYTSEGEYNITIIVTDEVGNTATKTVSFTIDKTKPFLEILSPANNTITNQSVTLTYSVSDNIDIPSEIVVSIGNGTVYSDDGNYTITINATDRAGNTASKTVSFTVDKTSPEITVTGVADGVYYNVSVTPVIMIADINLNTSSITLNGTPFVSGTTITEEGDYALFVQATDKAGNTASKTVSFAIDKTSPEITVTGVTNNAYYNVSVTPVIMIADINLNISSITLNGTSFVSSTTINAEGNYVLYVYATDKANNSATKTVLFIIDKTKPIITISGVEHGGCYNTDVMPVIDVSDDNLNITLITLNDNPFTNGTVVSMENTYMLVVQATDKAGNSANKTITFTVDKTAPAITIAESSQTTKEKTFTMHWSTTANDIQYYEVSTDGVNWINVSTDTQYIFTLSKGANTLYVRGTDFTGNKGTADITVTYQEKKQGKPGIISGFEASAFLVALLGVCIILLRRKLY